MALRRYFAGIGPILIESRSPAASSGGSSNPQLRQAVIDQEQLHQQRRAPDRRGHRPPPAGSSGLRDSRIRARPKPITSPTPMPIRLSSTVQPAPFSSSGRPDWTTEVEGGVHRPACARTERSLRHVLPEPLGRDRRQLAVGAQGVDGLVDGQPSGRVAQHGHAHALVVRTAGPEATKSGEVLTKSAATSRSLSTASMRPAFRSWYLVGRRHRCAPRRRARWPAASFRSWCPGPRPSCPPGRPARRCPPGPCATMIWMPEIGVGPREIVLGRAFWR